MTDIAYDFPSMFPPTGTNTKSALPSSKPKKYINHAGVKFPQIVKLAKSLNLFTDH